MIDLRENASTVAPPDVTFLTAAQIASPTPAILASTGTTFALDVAPYTRYVSNGTSLTPAVTAVTDSVTGGITGVTAGSARRSTNSHKKWMESHALLP